MIVSGVFLGILLGARLRGRTGTQRSKKGSEKVLERVLGKGSQKGSDKWVCYGFYSKKTRILRRVLRRGSEKGVNPEGAQNAPWRVRPLRRAPYESWAKKIASRDGCFLLTVIT